MNLNKKLAALSSPAPVPAGPAPGPGRGRHARPMHVCAVAGCLCILVLIAGCHADAAPQQICIRSRRFNTIRLRGGCATSESSPESLGCVEEAGVSQDNDKIPDENPRMLMFWRDHGIKEMKKIMYRGNSAPYGPKCNCRSCALSGRIFGDEVNDSYCCKFKPWFEEQVAACGMVIGYHPGSAGVHVEHDCDPLNGAWDVDCHLMYIGRSDWYCFGFGSKLWKSRTPNDPEVIKLKKLFTLLDFNYKEEESTARAA